MTSRTTESMNRIRLVSGSTAGSAVVKPVNTAKSQALCTRIGSQMPPETRRT